MKPKTEQTDGNSTFHPAPLEYWETCDSRQGGAVVTVDENGLCIRSAVDMCVGGKLNVKIFLFHEYVFEDIGVSARIVGKDICYEDDWEVYEYKLEFIRMSEEGRLKLRDYLKTRKSSDTPANVMA